MDCARAACLAWAASDAVFGKVRDCGRRAQQAHSLFIQFKLQLQLIRGLTMASKQGYGADLRKFMGNRVDLRLNGERRIAGIMKGYDQYMNIVLDEAFEIAKSAPGKEEAESNRNLGMIVIRGASVQLWENIDKVQ